HRRGEQDVALDAVEGRGCRGILVIRHPGPHLEVAVVRERVEEAAADAEAGELVLPDQAAVEVYLNAVVVLRKGSRVEVGVDPGFDPDVASFRKARLRRHAEASDGR